MLFDQTAVLELLKIIRLQATVIEDLKVYNEHLGIHLENIERLYLSNNNREENGNSDNVSL